MAFNLYDSAAANSAKGQFTSLHDDLATNESLELDLTRPALQQPTLELDLSTQSPKNQCGACVNYKNTVCLVAANPNKNSNCDSYQQWRQVEAAEVFGEIAPTKSVAVHGSTSSPRTESMPVRPESNLTVRPELVEGGTLPSMEEFAVAKLAESLNYTGQLTPGALEDHAVFHLKRSGESILEAGKAFLLLKESVGHGNFSKRINALGFEERTVRRYMQIAEGYGKTDNLSDLANTIQKSHKLITLLLFPKEDLAAIAEGGEVDGINAEKLKTMSASAIKELIKGRVEAEKQPLIEQVDSLAKQIENHQKHYGQLEAKLEVTEEKYKQLASKNKLGNDLLDIDTCKIREEAFAFEYGARLHLDYLRQLLGQAVTSAAPTEDVQLLRVNAIATATASIYAQVDDLYRYCQDVLGINYMPPILSGKHVLTPEEKQRLEDAKLVIEHKFNMDASSRETKRFKENRRAAGRPAGSPNKK